MKKELCFGKTTALLSATAFLALAGAISAQAAGWTQQNGQWYYYDNTGSAATNEWKKSGNYWFYLGDDGTMLRDSIIDDGENFYYVNEDGAMSVNRWIVTDPEVIGADGNEPVYLYLGSNGRAVKKSSSSDSAFLKRVIDGKTYAFDENGRMLTGWVNEDGEMLDSSDGAAFAEAKYYFGESNDGAMLTNSWFVFDNGYDAESNVDNVNYEDYEQLWVYFGSGGQKVAASDDQETTEKTINGQKYIFDQNGAMLSEWILASPSDAALSTPSNIRYFSESMDGHLKKNRWIYAVPDEEMDGTDFADDQQRWFYSGSSGKIYRNEIRKINGKRYIFDENGIMKSGFVLTDANGDVIGTIDREAVEHSDFIDGSAAEQIDGNNLYYFGADEAKDGAMQSGKSVKIELSDDTWTFGFASNGKAYGTDGVELVSSRYYQNGLLLSADRDCKYGVVKDAGEKLVVVNTSGAKQSGTKTLKDGNDGYLLLKDGAFFAYEEAEQKPVYANGSYYEYDADAQGKRGDEIAEDSDGSTLPEEMKLNFD